MDNDLVNGVDLAAWCARPSMEYREYMHAPFQQGGRLWAVTRASAIYVDVPGDVPRAPGVPDLSVVLGAPDRWILGWVPLPASEYEERERACPECEGSGRGPLVSCEHCGSVHACGSCEACEGTKVQLLPDPVATPSGVVAWAFYALMRELPACEIGVLTEWSCPEDSRIYFRFTGGAGLVIGLKSEDRERRGELEVMVRAARLAAGVVEP